MMSLTFGLFTQVSGSGPLGPLVMVHCLLSSFCVKVTFSETIRARAMKLGSCIHLEE